MPSTLVPVGFAALIGTALLADPFDVRALLAVLAFAVLPDLDTFVGLWLLEGGYRTALHNPVLPSLLPAGVWADPLRGRDSFRRSRWGPGTSLPAGDSTRNGCLICRRKPANSTALPRIRCSLYGKR